MTNGKTLLRRDLEQELRVQEREAAYYANVMARERTAMQLYATAGDTEKRERAQIEYDLAVNAHAQRLLDIKALRARLESLAALPDA